MREFISRMEIPKWGDVKLNNYFVIALKVSERRKRPGGLDEWADMKQEVIFL